MIGAAAFQRFLVAVQRSPQHTGQEHTIPDPPSDGNERVEGEIAAMGDPEPSTGRKHLRRRRKLAHFYPKRVASGTSF